MKTRRLIVWILTALLLCAMTVTAFAAGSQMNHIADPSGYLSDSERASLEKRAADISSRYNIGVYIFMVENYRDYSQYDDIYDCLIDIYDRSQLGCGSDHAGTSLMLSMSDRDYALDVNGERADYVFTEAGRDWMEDRILAYFRGNDFYGGFNEYLDCCEEYMQAAQNGSPVGEGEPSSADRGESGGFGIFSVIPGAIAAVLTGASVAAPMRSTGTKHDANNYVVPGSLRLHQQTDTFLHRTVTRRPRQTSSSGGSSGSSHHSSGSHSGRSGKF